MSPQYSVLGILLWTPASSGSVLDFVPFDSVLLNSVPLNSAPLNSVPLNSTPLDSVPPGCRSSPSPSLLLSTPFPLNGPLSCSTSLTPRQAALSPQLDKLFSVDARSLFTFRIASELVLVWCSGLASSSICSRNLISQTCSATVRR